MYVPKCFQTNITKEQLIEKMKNKEAAERLFPDYQQGSFISTQDRQREGFEAGVKWQQEQDKNKYSEEEVRNIVEQTIEKFYKHRYVETKSEMKELWFEQFKKK
jgi:hypothetical protein